MSTETLITPVSTDKAPGALGPYSQAQIVSAGPVEWVLTSGQVGIDPATGELVAGGTSAEAKQVMANLRAVLAEAGVDFSQVAKSTIFLADMNDFAAVNEIYGATLGEARPARSTVQVSQLPKGARIEIEMIAVREAT